MEKFNLESSLFQIFPSIICVKKHLEKMASTPTSTRSTTSTNSSNPKFDKRAQQTARAAVLNSLHSAGQSYDRKFQARAADLHSNAAAIKKQEKQLNAGATALGKERARMEREVARANGALKACGDLENWAEMLEGEFAVLEETLGLAENGRRQ